jgi:predicted RNase H-like nuclease
MMIVGVDCASSEKRIGLAIASIGNLKPTINKVKVGGGNVPVADWIAEQLPKDQPALLALDAPLGWPTALGSELFVHWAGMPLGTRPDCLFSRLTDRMIRQTLGKRPLEVGANLIARTAHSALSLLQNLREKTGLALPLAWEPGAIRETSAIEVYPAATLIVHGINVQGYKKPNASAVRGKLLERLSDHVEIAEDRGLLESNHDALDAAICVLAAWDFLQRKCIQPTDLETARKEGWIWVRHPNYPSF